MQKAIDISTNRGIHNFKDAFQDLGKGLEFNIMMFYILFSVFFCM